MSGTRVEQKAGKRIFDSRQIKVAEMGGPAGAKLNQKTWNRTEAQRGAVHDTNCSEIARSNKTRNFRSPRYERAG